jgi:hypothetical protein
MNTWRLLKDLRISADKVPYRDGDVYGDRDGGGYGFGQICASVRSTVPSRINVDSGWEEKVEEKEDG